MSSTSRLFKRALELEIDGLFKEANALGYPHSKSYSLAKRASLKEFIKKNSARKYWYDKAVAEGWNKPIIKSNIDVLTRYIADKAVARGQELRRKAEAQRQKEKALIKVKSDTVKPIGDKTISLRVIDLEDIKITWDTASAIKNFIADATNRSLDRRSKKDSKVSVRIVYSTDADQEKEPTNGLTLTTKDKISSDKLNSKINALLNSSQNNPDYVATLIAIHILEMTAGGCHQKTRPQTCQDTDGIDNYVFSSSRSTNENCAFSVFTHAFGVSGRDLQYAKARELVKAKYPDRGFEPNTQISLDQLPLIHAFYTERTNKALGLHVKVNMTDHLIIHPKDNSNTYVNISLRNGHYFSFQSTPLKSNVKKYMEFAANPVPSDRVIAKLERIIPKQLVSSDFPVYIHFDVSTEGIHTINKITVLLDTEIYTFKNVPDLVDSLIDSLHNAKVVVYSGQNTRPMSYLLNGLNQNPKSNLINILAPTVSIFTFTFGKNNRVIDLVNLIQSPFEDAVEDFKLSTETPEIELIKQIFTKVNTAVFDITKQNILGYLTTGQMAYEYWVQEDIIKRNIPFDLPSRDEHMKFISPSIYGGRNVISNKTYSSVYYQSPDITYENVVNSKDCKMVLDISSSYPAALRGTDILPTRYPVGIPRLSSNPEAEVKAYKMGIYNISYQSPENLAHLILPSTAEDGTVQYLRSGQGTYTSVDIETALSVGYIIQYQGDCLVWDRTEKPFDNFIDKLYPLKRSNNPTLSYMGKLMLNSLGGKLNQGNLDTTAKIACSWVDYESFTDEFDLTEFSRLGNDLLLSGKSFAKKTGEIKHPSHFYTFMLAYGRRSLINFIRIIDPTLTTIVSSYEDTDSLRVSYASYEKIVSLGYVKAGLGYLKNDLPNGAVIIHELNLAKKAYSYVYIDKNNKIDVRNSIKGIPTNIIKQEDLTADKKIVKFFPSIKTDKDYNVETVLLQRTINH